MFLHFVLATDVLAHVIAMTSVLNFFGRFLNQILSLDALTRYSTLVTPLSLSGDVFPLPGVGERRLPGVRLRPELAYHTSAVLASAIDTLSLPWRRRRPGDGVVRMYDVASGLGAGGRTVAEARMSLPFVRPHEQFLADYLQDATLRPISLLPVPTTSEEATVKLRAVSVRGLRARDLKPAPDRSGARRRKEEERSNPYRRCDSVSEALELYFGSGESSPAPTGVSASEVALPTVRPFPRILEGAEAEGSASALTCWESSSAAGRLCRSLAQRGAKVSLGRMHRFAEAGLEEDELREVLERLEATADAYLETGLM